MNFLPHRSRGFGALLLLLAVTACGNEPGPQVQSSEPFVKPMRVLPTNATAVDFVFDLIDADRVAAIPNTVGDYATVDVDFENWPEDRVFKEFSAEVILSLDPDLVVCGPWQDQNTIDRLLEAGVRVIELPAVDSLDNIREGLRMTGEALGEPEAAAELLADFNRRAKALEDAAKLRGKVRGLVYTNYGSGGWAAGSSTTHHHLLRLAGVSNVAAEAGRSGHDGVDIETLLDFDPDILVISQPSVYYGITRRFLETEKGLMELAAIHENRIIELPSGLFSTASHNLIKAAELLAIEVDKLVESGALVIGAE